MESEDGVTQGQQVLHYAACHDCDRYNWAHTAREAEEDAEFHAESYDHDAYHDSMEVSL